MARDLDTGICTIVNRAYFAHAKSLAESYLEQNPQGKIFILVVDPTPDRLRSKDRRIKYIPLSDLTKDRPLLMDLAFSYEAFEFCCALKPFFLEYLLLVEKLEKVLYFDSDILITGGLSSLFEDLDKSAILMTPHILDAKARVYKDGLSPNENTILIAGSYNAGFLGVSSEDAARDFLKWWGQSVSSECKRDVKQGYFCDQRYLDLVPGLFPQANIVRNPGCNVGFWNIHERKIEKTPDGYTSNGVPLLFYHFSGHNIKEPSAMSIHQNRYVLELMPAVRNLFHKYQKSLIKNGYAEVSNSSYGLTKFSNGVEIPLFVRGIYKKISKTSHNFSNPFEARGDNSFFDWLLGNGKELVPPLVLEMRALRQDVQTAFPVITNRAKQLELLEWATKVGAKEFKLGSVWEKILKLIEIRAQTTINFEREREARQFDDKASSTPYSFGINLVGYFESEKGVGVSVRKSKDCLTKASIPYALNNVVDFHSRNIFRLPHFDFIEENPFNINLIHVNPFDLEGLFKNKGMNYFRGRYNIGFWHWELTEFPKQLSKWFNYFDEIWVPSRFTQNILSQISPVPVVRIPICLDSGGADELAGKRTDLKFGIKETDFVFLFCFDFFSFSARKNPEGLVKAFRKAFSKRDNAVLIIKTSHGESFPKEFVALKDLALGARIHIIDEVLSELEINKLMHSCDCYVSLHRSEGYGLTILEAMSIGKPTIATAYSGNMDFTNDSNSFLIPYKDEALKVEYGPYKKGNYWAEPDIDKASERMRYVFENPDLAKEVGVRAAKHVQAHYSSSAVGKIYRQRLIELQRRSPRISE